MKLNKKKVKEFVKDNWPVIAIATVSAIGCGGLIAYTKHRSNNVLRIDLDDSKYEGLLDFITYDKICDHEYWYTGNTGVYKISDLGKYGEDMVKAIDTANPDEDLIGVLVFTKEAVKF